MPIRYEKHYTRGLCRRYPTHLFVFGDNLAGWGRKGQACIRDEPNAVGIPTKKRPSMDDDAFFANGDAQMFVNAVNPPLRRLRAHLKKGGFVVLPTDGIGTGLAELNVRAPVIRRLIDLVVEDLSATG